MVLADDDLLTLIVFLEDFLVSCVSGAQVLAASQQRKERLARYLAAQESVRVLVHDLTI